MKRDYRLLALAPLWAASAVGAQESPHEVSANVTLTTDYVFRGISQTSEDPAVQGGFDYAHDSGLYAGVWGSSLEFREGGDPASLELDYYGGYAGEANGLGYDLGAIYYDYPGNDAPVDLDYLELGGGLSYAFAGALAPTVSGYAWYSPDFFGEDGDALALIGDLELSLGQGFGLRFQLGQQDVDGDESTDGFDYRWGQVGVTQSLGPFDLELAYWNTDDDDECGDDLCDSRVVFSVSSSW